MSGMYPTTFFASRGYFTTSTPATSAAPLVGFIRPDRMRMVVVLPAPFGPMYPKISRSSTVRFIRSRATMFL